MGLEHEVELLDRTEVAAAVGALDVVLDEGLLQLLGGEDVGVLVEVLDQVVGPEGRLALGAVGEEVRELVNVPGGLEDLPGVDGLGVDLDEALAALVDGPPDLDDVVPEGASQRAVVVHAGHAAVELERRPDEPSAFAEGHQVVGV